MFKSILKFVPVIFLIVLIFGITHCNSENDKTANVKKQTVTLSSKEDSLKFENLNAYEPPNTIHYILDTAKSYIKWSCDIHSGYVKFKNGIIGVLNGKLINGNFIADMNSIVDVDIDYELMKGTLEKILKSPDFFNTAKYPNSFFKIDSTKQTKKNELKIYGYMKIFSKINKISFNSSIQVTKDSLMAKSVKFTIDRTKWGLLVYTKDHIDNEQGFIIPNEIYLQVFLTAYRVK